MEGDVPHNCPGPESKEAGHGSACSGCPNQNICQSGDGKGSNEGMICFVFFLFRDFVFFSEKVDLCRCYFCNKCNE
jgi:hypothetical protein